MKYDVICKEHEVILNHMKDNCSKGSIAYCDVKTLETVNEHNINIAKAHENNTQNKGEYFNEMKDELAAILVKCGIDTGSLSEQEILEKASGFLNTLENLGYVKISDVCSSVISTARAGQSFSIKRYIISDAGVSILSDIGKERRLSQRFKILIFISAATLLISSMGLNAS